MTHRLNINLEFIARNLEYWPIRMTERLSIEYGRLKKRLKGEISTPNTFQLG